MTLSLSSLLLRAGSNCSVSPNITVKDPWYGAKQWLGTKHTIENIYLQDPAFNDLDIEFLQLRGFTVIETPASDDLISSSTFLFIPYGSIRGQIRVGVTADPVYPSLYIGNDPRKHLFHHVYFLPDEEGEET